MCLQTSILYLKVTRIKIFENKTSTLRKKMINSNLIHEPNRRRLERVLFRQMYSNLPNTSFVRCSLGTEKLDGELVQAAHNRYFVLWLNQFNHICVHSPLSCAGGRHGGFLQKVLSFRLIQYSGIIPIHWGSDCVLFNSQNTIQRVWTCNYVGELWP